MADRRLPLKKLRRIARRFGVEEDVSGGKGSHTKFFQTIDGRKFTYPIPTSSKEIEQCYVAGFRRRFQLTPADGVSDEEFYGT